MPFLLLPEGIAAFTQHVHATRMKPSKNMEA